MSIWGDLKKWFNEPAVTYPCELCKYGLTLIECHGGRWGLTNSTPAMWYCASADCQRRGIVVVVAEGKPGQEPKIYVEDLGKCRHEILMRNPCPICKRL